MAEPTCRESSRAAHGGHVLCPGEQLAAQELSPIPRGQEKCQDPRAVPGHLSAPRDPGLNSKGREDRERGDLGIVVPTMAWLVLCVCLSTAVTPRKPGGDVPQYDGYK